MTQAETLQDAAEYLEKHIIAGWVAQGHHMSGAWEDSITTNKVSDNEIEGNARSYGMIVNFGITPARIPYGGEPTGAKTSKYIQGLFNYFKSKGKSDKDALSFAFATAKVQKKQGLSTQASRLYSSTGERQNFLQGVIDAIGIYLDNMIFDGLNDVIDTQAKEPETQYI